MSIKRILILCGSFLLFILVVVWLYRYLTTGTITVSTDNPDDYVGVSQIVEGEPKSNSYNKQAPHELTVHVKPGQYELTAGNRTIGTNKIVTLKARQHISFRLSPAKISFTEPVIGQDASFIAANASQLLFLGSDGKLMRINAANRLDTLDTATRFKSVQWLNTAFGIAQSGNNALFAVVNGTASQLQLPFTTGPETDVPYAVSPNGTVYASRGASIYAGGVGKPFKKIYEAKYGSLKLAASDKKVAVVYAGAADSEGTESDTLVPQITVISAEGKAVTTKEGSKFYKPVWSKNGKYLLVQGEHGYTVFDENLRQVVVLPSDSPNSAAWIDNGSLLYGVKNALWKYTIATSQSQKISQVSNELDEISISDDKAYAYVTSQSVTGNGAQEVTRTGLRGQSVPKNIQTLDLVLPETVGICSLNYINFTKLSITITYPALETTSKLCVDTAQKELRYYNLDPARFDYVINPQP